MNHGLRILAGWLLLLGISGCKETGMQTRSDSISASKQAVISRGGTQLQPQDQQASEPDWEIVLRLRIEVIAEDEQAGTIDVKVSGPIAGTWRIKPRFKPRFKEFDRKIDIQTFRYSVEYVEGELNALRIRGVGVGTNCNVLIGQMLHLTETNLEAYLASYGTIVSKDP